MPFVIEHPKNESEPKPQFWPLGVVRSGAGSLHGNIVTPSPSNGYGTGGQPHEYRREGRAGVETGEMAERPITTVL
jgi:hypothetical protein